MIWASGRGSKKRFNWKLIKERLRFCEGNPSEKRVDSL